jgi:hypothetical protein
MAKRIIIIVLGIFLSVLLIYGALYAYGAYTLAKLHDLEVSSLPPSAFDQHEFPKEKVEAMMRSCVRTEYARNRTQPMEKPADYCGCLINARVHNFTLMEYYTAGNAHWDPKIVPDAVKKHTQMQVDCEKSTYK